MRSRRLDPFHQALFSAVQKAPFEELPPYLRMFYAARGELLEQLYDRWMLCEALTYVNNESWCPECASSRQATIDEMREIAAERVGHPNWGKRVGGGCGGQADRVARAG